MKNRFYITAAIPYVNGRPHIGHALEFVQSDVIARYKKLSGFDALLISGSDENGLKITQAAEQQNISPQQLADNNTNLFLDIVKKLSVSIDVWRRATDKKYHWPGTEILWKLSLENGDIYKKNYGGYYCVGCEDFYTKKDLVDGKCPEHLKKPEWVEEENYFFRLSKYEKQIENLITIDKVKVVPQTRKNEVLSFIKKGLEDFSISRNRERAKNWGIPVPGDDSQVIYTWYDALNVYQTAVGFGYDEKLWKKWWPADLHVIGKGILRFHAIYWIGMLLSAKLPLPKTIFVHGYVSSGGHKMSKSLGNVIDPFEVIKKYGTEATRYYLLREIPAHGDGDFTFSRFEQLYNADLANGLGNLVSRVAKLCETTNLKVELPCRYKLYKFVKESLDNYRFDFALQSIWEKIQGLDKQMELKKPWENPEKKHDLLVDLVEAIREISHNLQPFMPETAERILTQFKGPTINSTSPLFPRL